MANSRIREAVVLELLELDKLNDDAEIARRTEYIQKILMDVYDYEHYLSEYDFKFNMQSLCNRGLKFSAVENAEQIKHKWDDIFTNAIASVQKDEIFYTDFKWHIFSYNVLNSLEKDAANSAFLNCAKSDVYVFFQHSNECYKIDNCHLFKESDLTNPQIHDFISDFYIFDMVEKWTYICTHAENCGPYFYQVK